jgi:hypothetical protein
MGRRRAEPEAAPDTQTPQRPRDEWRELAPLDRVVTSVLDTDSTAGTRAFIQQLPSRWSAPPAIQQLGHDVRPDLASGIVRGLTSTVNTAAAPSDTNVTDLRWWRGRRGQQRRLTEAAGSPEVDAVATPTPTDEADDVPPVALLPALPPRPVAALPALTRSAPAVLSRRQPGTSTPAIEPVQPRPTLPLSLGPDPEGPPARVLPLPGTPDVGVRRAGPSPVPTAGDPVRVVPIDPTGPSLEARPDAANSPEPSGADAPQRAAGSRPRADVSARRRRSRLGAPLPSADAALARPGVLPEPARPPLIEPAPRAAEPTDGREVRATPASGADGPDSLDAEPAVRSTPAAPTSVVAARTSNIIDATAPPAVRPAIAPEPPHAERADVARTAPAAISESLRRSRPPIETAEATGPDTETGGAAPVEPTGNAAIAAAGIAALAPSVPVRLVPGLQPEPNSPARAPLVAERPLAGVVRAITSRDASTSQSGPASPVAGVADALGAVRSPRGIAGAAMDAAERVAPAVLPAALGAAASYLPRLFDHGSEPAVPQIPGLPALPGLPGVGAAPRRGMPAPVPALAPATRPAPAAPQTVEVTAPGFVPPAQAPAAPLDASPARPTTAESTASDEPAAAEDPAALDRLANQLYARVQNQLRSELLIGRERAQMLTDLG